MVFLFFHTLKKLGEHQPPLLWYGAILMDNRAHQCVIKSHYKPVSVKVCEKNQ